MPGERVIRKYRAEGRTWAFIVHVNGRYRVAAWDWTDDTETVWRYNGRRHRFLRMAHWHAKWVARGARDAHRTYHLRRQRRQMEEHELRSVDFGPLDN